MSSMKRSCTTQLSNTLRGCGEHAMYHHGKSLPPGDNVTLRDVGAHRRPVIIPPRSFGPAVPPKDQTSQNSCVSVAPKMSLDVLVPGRMLDDLICIVRKDPRLIQRELATAGRESGDELGPQRFDGTSEMLRFEDDEVGETRDAKRDTVENLVTDIQADMQHSMHDTLAENGPGIRTSIIPLPLHLHRKPTSNPTDSNEQPTSKLSTAKIHARPSLRINTNFINPRRLAPLPTAQLRRSNTQPQLRFQRAPDSEYRFGTQKRNKTSLWYHTARAKRERQLSSPESKGCSTGIIMAAKSGYENLIGVLKPEPKPEKARRKKKGVIEKKWQELKERGIRGS